MPVLKLKVQGPFLCPFLPFPRSRICGLQYQNVLSPSQPYTFHPTFDLTLPFYFSRLSFICPNLHRAPGVIYYIVLHDFLVLGCDGYVGKTARQSFCPASHFIISSRLLESSYHLKVCPGHRISGRSFVLIVSTNGNGRSQCHVLCFPSILVHSSHNDGFPVIAICAPHFIYLYLPMQRIMVVFALIYSHDFFLYNIPPG